MTQQTREQVAGLVMAVADTEWFAGVEDRVGTPGIARILSYIREGLGWDSAYRRDGDFAWCGAFVAYCWAAAGLHPVLRRECFASTYRLWCYGRHLGEFHPWTRVRLTPGGSSVSLRQWWEELSAARGVDCRRLMQRCAPGKPLEWEPAAGDVALVGADPALDPGKIPEWGQHVALVRRYDPRGVIETVEGNAWGLGPAPEGEVRQYEGVVHCVRPLLTPEDWRRLTYHVRYIIRPGLADCVPGVEYL
jgi:hypothetical protein